MDDEQYRSEESITTDLESRNPSLKICWSYVVGGFAIRGAGYIRDTGDIDIIIDTELDNEASVFKSLEILPDKAVLQLEPGEVEKYTVVRVADEIVVDLMKSASGIDYEEASKDIVIRHVQGVPIPFASVANEEEYASGKGRCGFGFSAHAVP